MSDRPVPSVFRREGRPGTGSGSNTSYIATGTQSEGDFGLFESLLAPGARGPGPHYHEHFSESFYVLEGELEILTAGDPELVGAGDFAYVPRDAVHGFRNGSPASEVRFLILFSPGIAREQYFEGLVELQRRGADIAEIDEFARRHDQVNLRG